MLCEAGPSITLFSYSICSRTIKQRHLINISRHKWKQTQKQNPFVFKKNKNNKTHTHRETIESNVIVFSYSCLLKTTKNIFTILYWSRSTKMQTFWLFYVTFILYGCIPWVSSWNDVTEKFFVYIAMHTMGFFAEILMLWINLFIEMHTLGIFILCNIVDMLT